jgi:hypothetical protein
MKSILPAFALLSSVAFAGSEVAYQSSSDAVTPAAAESTWYAGGSVGHLSERDETLYTLHLGANILRSGAFTHSLFTEVGFSEKDGWQAEQEFIPVTLNYKLDYQFGDGFSLYAGLGAGAAWIDGLAGFATNWPDSVEFMAQAFAGINYEVCASFQLYAGNRYIWIDDSDLPPSISMDSGDDVVMEIGARFRF